MKKNRVSINIISSFNHLNFVGLLKNSNNFNWHVNDVAYNTVFQNAWRVILASMIAYLCAQFLDVRLFHFWKNLTKGKHLWLRNNASTIGSQLVDTILVICVLFAGVWPSGQIMSAIFDGWLFKMLCALVDTPIIYGVLYLLRKKFNLKFGEELS